MEHLWSRRRFLGVERSSTSRRNDGTGWETHGSSFDSSGTSGSDNFEFSVFQCSTTFRSDATLLLQYRCACSTIQSGTLSNNWRSRINNWIIFYVASFFFCSLLGRSLVIGVVIKETRRPRNRRLLWREFDQIVLLVTWAEESITQWEIGMTRGIKLRRKIRARL